MNNPKLTKEQIEEIQTKYANGMTQKALAQEYGVSQSLIQKRCGGPYRSYNKREKVNAIKYRGIKNYLQEHVISIREFARECGMNYVALYYVITGRNEPRKYTIDKILSYTGLTYEDAFAVDD